MNVGRESLYTRLALLQYSATWFAERRGWTSRTRASLPRNVSGRVSPSLRRTCHDKRTGSRTLPRGAASWSQAARLRFLPPTSGNPPVTRWGETDTKVFVDNEHLLQDSNAGQQRKHELYHGKVVRERTEKDQMISRGGPGTVFRMASIYCSNFPLLSSHVLSCHLACFTFSHTRSGRTACAHASSLSHTNC